MDSKQYTVIIKGEDAIKKLDSLGRRKGEYLSYLVNKDIRVEMLEQRVKELEDKKDGSK